MRLVPWIGWTCYDTVPPTNDTDSSPHSWQVRSPVPQDQAHQASGVVLVQFNPKRFDWLLPALTEQGTGHRTKGNFGVAQGLLRPNHDKHTRSAPKRRATGLSNLAYSLAVTSEEIRLGPPALGDSGTKQINGERLMAKNSPHYKELTRACYRILEAPDLDACLRSDGSSGELHAAITSMEELLGVYREVAITCDEPFTPSLFPEGGDP